MKERIFLLLLIFAALKGKGQIKDTLFLYNGQILIGEIKSMQLGEITIDDTDLKIIAVKFYKVKLLKTKRQFKIETNEHHLYFGALRPTNKPGWIDIISEGQETITVDMLTLSLVVPLERSFFSRLNGTLSAGFSYTKSNAIGQINLSSSIMYTTRRFEYQFTASANYSIDSSKFSRDREDLGLLGGYYLTPSWFIAASASYQRNLELSIARRYQQMIGAGNKIFVKRNWQMLAVSGVTFNQEKSTSDVSSGLLLEIPLILRFNFFQFQHPNIQISSSQSLCYGITQTGRVRYDGNTNFSWELIRYFYLTINPYSNFDSQPPAGTSNFDFGVVLSLSYKF